MKSKINLLIVLLAFSLVGIAQDNSDADLAKASQNPLAAMYSLPFQNNTTYGNGPYDRAQNVMNIQPVIPVKLNDKVNLVNRIVLPIISQPSPTADESSTGLGDTNWSAWLSPAKASKIVYGGGLAVQLPTSTGREYGSGEFGVGPSLVMLTMIDKWVAGIVTNNIWTFGDAEESKFLFQYFVNYNLPKAFYLVTAPILTANWNQDSDERWVVPFGGGAGKIFRIGKLPVNFNAQVYYNVDKPTGVGDWQSRFQLQFLFPK
ncbi:MAG: hypothetical protein OCD76_13035 [Reichenbachiella sp.]